MLNCVNLSTKPAFIGLKNGIACAKLHCKNSASYTGNALDRSHFALHIGRNELKHLAKDFVFAHL